MLFLSLLAVMIGVTTWMTEGVVKVEFGLEGIIQGCKVRQECLHNHYLWLWRIHSFSRAAIHYFAFNFHEVKELSEGIMSVLIDI